MNNSNKIILDLCGGTGAWSRPYVEAGYDVRLITLPDNNVLTYVPPKEVYGVLAAPPCTMFSRARTRAKTPIDINSALEIVKACYRIIEQCFEDDNLHFWAIENPATGSLRNYIGEPDFEFHPWEFGDMYKKYTALWGQFEFPIKTVLKEPNELIPMMKQSKYLPRLTKDYMKSLPEKGRSKSAKRAITPTGFAKAFQEVNF